MEGHTPVSIVSSYSLVVKNSAAGCFLSVDNPEFEVSLNTWLRSTARLTGTKVMCAEGGCGVCVVMITRRVPGTSHTKSFAANSVSLDSFQLLAYMCYIFYFFTSWH